MGMDHRKQPPATGGLPSDEVETASDEDALGVEVPIELLVDDEDEPTARDIERAQDIEASFQTGASGFR